MHGILLCDLLPVVLLITFFPTHSKDIVGFTKWSSSRAPTDVFELLQTLYASMDKIAKRRRVYKIETIGDCYLAVAGLPNPLPDHAVAVTKFARECLDAMANTVIPSLIGKLGPDTSKLTMRVGIHSGPITAGVLRGEKSRYQVFGDTVNTGARMESTGSPGKIQVSKSTAELLIDTGKGNWLIPREDIVSAKGKGKMETFWVNIATTRSVSPSDIDDSVRSHSQRPVEK